MENASQALIIAGAILIAIIILSIGVYLFASYSKVSESYELAQGNQEISKFNANFMKFKDRTNITAQEIVTLKNFAENYDKQNGTTTTVEYSGKGTVDAEFIKNYAPGEDGKMQYFKLENLEDINKDGRIDYIKFVKN